jgi:hypothetical protein
VSNRLANETSSYPLEHEDIPTDSHSHVAEDRWAEETSAAKAMLPASSGIYQIRCLPTGKIYIGSASNLRTRWGQHRRKLRRGTHHNTYLQAAWDKHGETNFAFTIVELVEKPDLLEAEQGWLDRTGCADREIGFNIYDTAGSPGDTLARTWEGFFDPGGNAVTIVNLYEFCRLHGLDFPSMHRLATGQGKIRSYKGWTHINSPRKRDYVKTYDGFIAPDGLPVDPITNLAAFCREHGLDNTHMVAVARGRIYSHRGWTYNNARQNLSAQKVHEGFVDPDGQQVVISNLAAFCREHNLNIVHMHGLKSGKRRSHKGWTWRNPHE